MKIPDRWLKYNESAVINGTRFVAFKTPLKEGYSSSVPAHRSFSPRRLLHKHPNIKLVIDLTFTTKYYDSTKEFEDHGIQHIKIKCKGHKIPKDSDFQKFLQIVDQFTATNPEKFCRSRRHAIERTAYIRDLLKKSKVV